MQERGPGQPFRSVLYVLGAEIRRRILGWIALGVLVGLLAGAVLSLVAGARRTGSAFERFSEASASAHVTVEASTTTAQRKVLRLGDVQAVGRWMTVPGIFLIRDEQLAPLDWVMTGDAGFGRLVDRPLVRDGRAVVPGRREAVANQEWLQRFQVDVGDRVQLWSTGHPGEEVHAAPADGPDHEDHSAEPVDPFELFATDPSAGHTVDVTIVGRVVLTAAEVAQGASGRDPRLFLDLVLAAEVLEMPPGDLLQGLRTSSQLALRLDHEADQHDFARQLDGMRDVGSPVLLDDLFRSVDAAVRPQIIISWALAGVLAVAGAVVLGPALYRQSLADAADHGLLRSLGASVRVLDALAAARALFIFGPAAMTVTAVAALVSPRFPVGTVATVEANPGAHLDALVLGVGLVVLGSGVLAVAVAGARTQHGRPATVAHRPGASPLGSRLSLLARLGWGFAFPAAAPARAVLRSVRLAVILSVAAALGLGVLSSSVDDLLEHPERQGWGWDLAVTCKEGLCFRIPSLGPALATMPHVDSHAFAAFSFISAQSGDVSIPLVAYHAGRGQLQPLVLLEGRPPSSPGEVVLGSETMASVGARVGDRVELTTPNDRAALEVVGRGVFAGIGLSDAPRPTLGTGAAVHPDRLDRLVGGEQPPGFILVRTRGERSDAVAELRAGLPTDFEILAPRAVGDLSAWVDLQTVPPLLVAFLLGLAVLTIGHGLVLGNRLRSRDLSTLRALGLGSSGTRSVIHWQVIVLVVVCSALAVPLGFALGRVAWEAYGDQLGVRSPATLDLAGVAAAVGASAVLLVLISFVVSRHASRPPSNALRRE